MPERALGPVTRWDELNDLLVDGAGRGDTYCTTACGLLRTSACALTLVASVGQPLVCVSDPVAASLEDLQFTLGEGPSIEADATGMLVAGTDLAGPEDGMRWPQFSPSAVASGVRAAFAVPMRVGAARLGVLSLYNDRPGPLTPDALGDALVFGAVLTKEIVRAQAAAPAGALAPPLADAGAHRAEVHQASGMVSVQLGVTVLDALLRLRGYAYAHDRPVADVAADVVAGKLRLDT